MISIFLSAVYVMFFGCMSIDREASELEQTHHRLFQSVLAFIFMMPLFMLSLESALGKEESQIRSLNCSTLDSHFISAST